MHALRVGDRYPGSLPPAETPAYVYLTTGQRLTLFYAGPTAEEIADVRRGDSEFALVEEGEVLFLLYRLGGSPWGDALFSVHLVPPERRSAPDGRPATNLLQIVLVNLLNRKIEALRTVSLSRAFAEEMGAALRRQLESPWNQAAYDARLQVVYGGVTTEDLLRRAKVWSRGDEIIQRRWKFFDYGDDSRFLDEAVYRQRPAGRIQGVGVGGSLIHGYATISYSDRLPEEL